MGADIKLLRQQLGLSGRQLADLLGCSRSLLSLAELGQRTLSGPGADALNRLQALADTPQAKSAAGQPPLTKAAWSKLRKARQHVCNGKKAKLADLEETVDGLNALINVARAYAAANHASDQSDIKLAATIAHRKAAARLAILQRQMALLQIDIAGLQGQLAAIDEAMGGLGFF
jgi:transcriptional regulator with XRE-family HTH domain